MKFTIERDGEWFQAVNIQEYLKTLSVGTVVYFSYKNSDADRTIVIVVNDGVIQKLPSGKIAVCPWNDIDTCSGWFKKTDFIPEIRLC